MKAPSSNWEEMRRKVLGLGESSVRKTHYPSLMQRLGELERFRSLVDMSSDLLFVVECPSGRILDVSAACCEHLGITRDELLSLSFAQLLSPEAWKNTLGEMERLRSATRRGSTVTTEIGSAGRRVPVEIAIQSFVLDDGDVALLAARDITERQKAEKRILKLNRLYRVITQVNKTIVKTENRDTLFHEVCRLCVEWGDFRLVRIALFDGNTLVPIAWAGDDSLLPITGCSSTAHPCAEAARGGCHYICNHLPEGVDCHREAVRRGYRSACAIPLQARGKAVGMLALYSDEADFFDEEEVELLEGVANDISFALDSIDNEEQRRWAEKVQEDTLRKIEAIFEASPVAISALDDEGRVSLWNKTAEQMFGWMAEETLGKVLPIVPDQFEPEHKQILAQVLRGEFYTGEVKRRKKDGSQVDLGLSIAPLRDVNGNVRGGIAMYADIGERKRLEARLIQANKLESIGRLAGGVAHDFNNLLTVINGHADLLLKLLPVDHALRTNCGEILKAGERAAELTRQLLAFSRTQVLQPKVLSCNTIIADMENMLRRLIGENVQLATMLDPQLGNVLADAGQIEQVIMNLVVNARDAIRDTGAITIRTGNADAQSIDISGKHSGEYISISVSDDGVGMDEETQRRIFEPFFTTKQVGKGTGLGLSMVWGIVNQSGGHIVLSSEPNHGTSFTVYLPQVQDRANRESVPEPTSIPRGTETLLLVEDRQDVRQLTAEILRGCGYRVLEAASAAEALALWDRNLGAIDLVVTDVVMPEMNGPELARQLKAVRPDVKILYVSGHASSSVLDETALSDGSAFLEKPFSPRKLATTVHSLLEAEARKVA